MPYYGTSSPSFLVNDRGWRISWRLPYHALPYPYPYDSYDGMPMACKCIFPELESLNLPYKF